MTELALLEMARAEGFNAAMIEPENIPVNPAFRMFCEENRCGKYNANYSCPPDCGTVEELRAKTLAEDMAMILTTKWDIGSYENKEAIQEAKKSHNAPCCGSWTSCASWATRALPPGTTDALSATPASGFWTSPVPSRTSESAVCPPTASMYRRLPSGADWNLPGSRGSCFFSA